MRTHRSTTLSAVLLGLFFFITFAETAKPANVTDPATKGDRPLITSLSSESFQAFLQAMGFECIRGKDNSGKDRTFFTFLAEGYTVAAFVNDDGSVLQLYSAFSDVKPTLATANEWNQKNNFSRASVDDKGDAVLESELILGGGVTRENIELFIRTFRNSVARWARFSLERQK